MKIENLKSFLKNKILKFIPDKIYISIIFKKKLKYKLNLKNPKTLNEKLQWIKLHDRKKIYSTLVDKYEVKKYVANIIGEEYIIPTLGIYDKFDDIDFNKLPNQFVIKCTHDSGTVVVCTDKENFDIASARKKINDRLKINYYTFFREWPYKNVKPRIIVEKYMGSNMIDYKFQCFNGNVDNVLLCIGRDTKEGVKYYYFDENWKYLPYCIYEGIDISNFTLPKPDKFSEMLKIAEKLGKDYLEIRVDLYCIDNKIYFGELTFFSSAGMDTDITYEADVELGKKLKLPYELGGRNYED